MAPNETALVGGRLSGRSRLPAPECDNRPNGLNYAERPRPLKEAIRRTECARSREPKYQPGAPIFQCVTDEHGGDGKQAEGGKCVHPIIFMPNLYRFTLTHIDFL